MCPARRVVLKIDRNGLRDDVGFCVLRLMHRASRHVQQIFLARWGINRARGIDWCCQKLKISQKLKEIVHILSYKNLSRVARTVLVAHTEPTAAVLRIDTRPSCALAVANRKCHSYFLQKFPGKSLIHVFCDK